MFIFILVGVVSFVPHTVARGKEFPLPVPVIDVSNVPAGVYVMRSAAQICCELKDERGTYFSVISNGEMAVKRQEEAVSEKNADNVETKDKKTSGTRKIKVFYSLNQFLVFELSPSEKNRTSFKQM